MVNKKAQPDNSITSGSDGRIETIYAGRKVKVFSIFENEFQSLSYMNTLSNLSFSVAAFFLNEAISPFKLIPFLASLVLFIFGGWAIWNRMGITQKIKEQSFPVDN